MIFAEVSGSRFKVQGSKLNSAKLLITPEKLSFQVEATEESRPFASLRMSEKEVSP
jgi:hypothetical protein